MPKKCESCKHYEPKEPLPGDPSFFAHGHCSRYECLTHDFRRRGLTRVAVMFARQICDREGDGHFVYFEPRDPPICPRCDDNGTILVCPDGVCQGTGECMHGDGETICPVCNGANAF